MQNLHTWVFTKIALISYAKKDEWQAACKDMCKMYEIRFGEKDRDSVFAKAACDGLHRSDDGKPT